MSQVPIEEQRAIRNGGQVLIAGGRISARDLERETEEKERREAIELRRVYLNGNQYDDENAAAAKVLGVKADCLPEHLKLQAYSTQIQESVEFIASQLAESFVVKAEDSTVDERIQTMLISSPALSGGHDAEDDLSITNVLRDALVAQDTPTHVRWDPVRETTWWEFWASEEVEFRYAENDRYRLEEVVLTEYIYEDTVGSSTSLNVKVPKTTTWKVVDGECVTIVQINKRPPEPPVGIGIPMIPWGLLRGNHKNLRADRGESIITNQAMNAADRYNAVEQVAWLIARYNSHGNLAVMGDESTLLARISERINKDVADVMIFPGGTNLQTIELPTDPKMIQHQREVLLDSLYGAFGLVRMDQSTIEGLGRVSGYALEILNRKSEGTFSQIRKQFIRDLRRLFNLSLDIDAYRRGDDTPPVEEDEDAEIQGEPVDPEESEDIKAALAKIDPLLVYPKRRITVEMGTGFIVDDVLVREDFTAGLISHQEALRKRGYSDEQIKDMLDEIDARKEKSAEESGFSQRALTASSRTQAVGENVANGSRLTGDLEEQ